MTSSNFNDVIKFQVNRMMGREAQDGQMSVLLVVSVAWFIFGSVVVVVNQVTISDVTRCCRC